MWVGDRQVGLKIWYLQTDRNSGSQRFDVVQDHLGQTHTSNFEDTNKTFTISRNNKPD